MWQCKICDHLNEDELQICEACGASRDIFGSDDIDDEYYYYYLDEDLL